MKIRLLDYLDNEHFVEIPDNTEEIVIKVLSGDMVMTSPIDYDTSNDRIMDFYDGEVVLTKDEFYKLNEIETSYDIFE